MMTATIEINRLRIRALHGVLIQERIAGNIFEVTVHLHYPIEDAINSDNLNDTLNYAKAVDIIKAEMDKPSQLLEHVVGRIKASLLKHFPEISGSMIKLAKVTPPISTQLESVAIKIEW